MKTGTIIDGITINIFDSRVLMGEAAAKATASAIKKLLDEKGEVNMMFAAAPSQNEFLEALVKEDVSWGHINAFHMDEYIGLPPGSTATFAYYLQQYLFNRVSFKTLHYINGAVEDATIECSRYTLLLQKHPIDIVCMGIGENNHIAFNDPPVADFNDAETVKIVTLDEACRQQQVNDGCFPTFDAVPAHALTLTVPALLNCRYIFCIVPGERKAQAVFHTFDGPIIELYPSTALRRHGNVQMFLDRESVRRLVD